MEYGEWGSTDAGEDTELSVWFGDRESTVTSPSVRADRENKDRKKKSDLLPGHSDPRMVTVRVLLNILLW